MLCGLSLNEGTSANGNACALQVAQLPRRKVLRLYIGLGLKKPGPSGGAWLFHLWVLLALVADDEVVEGGYVAFFSLGYQGQAHAAVPRREVGAV